MNPDMTQRSKTLRGDHCRCSPLTGCGEYFNSTYAFDKHRTGKHGVDRRCLSPPEMLAKGMHQKPNGYWISEIPRVPLGHVRAGEAISEKSHPTEGAGS